ncbi:hypothetical protein N2152v2_008007 [Parachlorella kessleri]
MSLLPPFDPTYFGQALFDPYYALRPDPYSYGNTRRRVEGEAEASEGAGEGQAGRQPYVRGSAGWTRSIPVDFIERKREYVVRADIPGVHKDEIHIEVHDGNVLRFGHNPHAEREKEDTEEAGIFHRAERVSTFRNRNLRMPDDCDLQAQVTAKYEDGVLTITIPKKEGAGKTPARVVPIA